MPEAASVTTTHRFISFDETPIHYYRIKASGALKALAIIVHGMGEHGGRYRALAEYLSELGIECYLPDLRGFGRSGGKRACLNSFSDFHRDLETLHAFVLRTHREVPVFLIGHSLGGLVASSYLVYHQTLKVQGLVLSSPLFGIGVPIPFWRHCLALGISFLFPDYSEPSRVDPGLLTHDKEILKDYAKDECIFHRISARLYREVRNMTLQKEQIAKRLTLPVLLLQAGEDRIVSKEASIRFFHSLKSLNKELEVYDHFYHEIFNEIGRDTVYSRIGIWFSRQISHK